MTYGPTHSPQYSPQYSHQAYQTPDQLLGPARIASLIMVLVGTVLLLFGGCVLAALNIVPKDEFLRGMEQGMAQTNPELNVSGEQLLTGIMIVSGGLAGVGLLLVIAGVIVRSGSLGACVFSIVVVGMILLLMVVMVISSLISSLKNPAELLGLCMLLVPTIALGAALAMLIKAARNAGKIEQAKQYLLYWQQQYQVQMQQAWMQQQANQQQSMQYRPPGQP
jgi:hypothetical protein